MTCAPCRGLGSVVRPCVCRHYGGTGVASAFSIEVDGVPAWEGCRRCGGEGVVTSECWRCRGAGTLPDSVRLVLVDQGARRSAEVVVSADDPPLGLRPAQGSDLLVPVLVLGGVVDDLLAELGASRSTHLLSVGSRLSDRLPGWHDVALADPGEEVSEGELAGRADRALGRLASTGAHQVAFVLPRRDPDELLAELWERCRLVGVELEVEFVRPRPPSPSLWALSLVAPGGRSSSHPQLHRDLGVALASALAGFEVLVERALR